MEKSSYDHLSTGEPKPAIMTTFNPFGTILIRDLKATDLAVLSDIPEGWFIEYKREPDQPTGYAKEASGFANARGGWIFVGLEEDKKTRLPICKGPGLPRNDTSRLLDSARDAIHQNLSPPPFLELTIIDGPIPALGVPNDRSILVIHIPESHNTPHIHSSGRIYKRQADASNPVKDRVEFDELYRKKKRLHERILEHLELGFDEQWLQEFNIPWIHLAVMANPGDSNQSSDISFERFKQIVRGTNTLTPLLPDIFQTYGGFIANNRSHQEIADGPAMSLQYTNCHCCHITLPLSGCHANDQSSPTFLDNNNGLRFLKLLAAKRLGDAQIFDGSLFASSVFQIGKFAFDLLTESSDQNRYIYRLSVKNVFRHVPYFNSQTYLSWCTSNSIPIIDRNEFHVPWVRKLFQEVGKPSHEEFFTDRIVDIMCCFGINEPIMRSVIMEAKGNWTAP